MTTEDRRPPPNQSAGDNWTGALKVKVRQFLDLQVATVTADVHAWLAKRSGSILEVGCGDQPYRPFVPAGCTYTGLEWERARTDFAMQANPDTVYYEGDTFPFADATFDNLFHTEVLEHVIDYQSFLGECHRVMKPGAPLLLSVPFQARFHFIPHDYWRFTPSGLQAILEEAGFRSVRVEPRGTDVTVALYKSVAVFYRLAYGGPLGKLAFAGFSPAVVAMLSAAHASIKLGVGSKDDCLGYTVYAVR